MKALPPKISHLYRKYDEIALDHCKSLIAHLYEGKVGSWVNPITGNTINNGSYITINFLSKCYYLWGNKIATINSKKLKYKKHIEKFIAKEYLFDISAIKQLAVSKQKKKDKAVVSMNTMMHRGGLLHGTGVNSRSPSNSPPAARRRSPSLSPPAAQSPNPLKLEFPKNIKNSSKIIVEKKFITGDELTEERCNNFLTDIEKKLRGKTETELSNINIQDPIISSKNIAIGSQKLLIYLSKCYYSFDKPIQDRISKIVYDVEDLIVLTDDKEKIKQAIPIIEGKLKKLMDNFNECCDTLIKNCEDGILPSHKYIADIVNAILVIIYTKYLHLYDVLTPTTYDKPLHIYMYDDDFHKYYIENGLNSQLFTYIIYQKDDLMKSLNETKIDLKPKTIERYEENTLFNRQYVFELSKKDKVMTIIYNMINSRENTFEQDFNALELDATLEYAYNLLFNKDPFNYNITNSVLPKIIKIECLTPSVLRHFDEILHTINTRLETLPVIKDVRSTSDPRYNSEIVKMKECGFGENDMIRKNILYSLNAQVPSYIKLYSETTLGLKDFFKDKIYYNYGYTGTFPLFTWIPISSSEPDGTIYNFPSSSKWQPYGADKTEIFKQVDKAYKNYYTQPFSKSLNETIYKVISGKSTDVDTRMKKRINETIGIYKDMDKAETYKNKKIYLYHGTNQKLHYMDGKKEDIELLGFLSTTLNIYTASFYSEVGLKGNGFIYIIEVDDTQTYINLNDQLYQFILLPHSIIRIVHEFDYMGITIILCRLIETPTKEQSNELYNKLLTNAKVAVFYYIKQNNNAVPICAGFRSGDNFKKGQRLTWNIGGVRGSCDTDISSKHMDIFQIPREWLASATLPLNKSNKYELYVYFSLLQENEVYVARGLPVLYGGFDDIKYSIHQHFIKDCYKYLNIPCINYVFLHGDENTKNKIATGILLDDYKANRKSQYKYDINNFLIDCIFNFDSIDNDNRKLDLHISDIPKENKYAMEIEGFRNSGLYNNGDINPRFRYNPEEHFEYIIEYVKKYKNFFSKYKDASEEDLKQHFKLCNTKITRLIGIIDHLKDKYLTFINDTLKGDTDIQHQKDEIIEMFNNLTSTLRQRALFYYKLTNEGKVLKLVNIIKIAIKEAPDDDKYSELLKDAVISELILSVGEGKKGGKHGDRSAIGIGVRVNSVNSNAMKQQSLKTNVEKKSNEFDATAYNKIMEEDKKILEEKIEAIAKSKELSGSPKLISKDSSRYKIKEEYKNIPISGYKSMYKFEDLPEDFQKYYGKQNKGKEIDISNSCHIRLVPRKDTSIMGNKPKAKRRTI
jgi:hypothetical protein